MSRTSRGREWDRPNGRTCVVAIPLHGRFLLCVDLFVDRGAPTVCIRIYKQRPEMLPKPTPLWVAFDATHLAPLLEGLRSAQRILASAVPIMPPDPADSSSPRPWRPFMTRPTIQQLCADVTSTHRALSQATAAKRSPRELAELERQHNDAATALHAHAEQEAGDRFMALASELMTSDPEIKELYTRNGYNAAFRVAGKRADALLRAGAKVTQ